jgi:hypothetical protein
MPRRTIPPDLRQLIEVIADALENTDRKRSNRIILEAIDKIRRSRHPKPRKRPGPKLPNPLLIFVACETVLTSLEAQKSWDELTRKSITVAVQEHLKDQEQPLVYSIATLRPYVDWFVNIILVWEDSPPRVRYKVHTIKKREHWHDADVKRLDATRRLAAFPRHPRRVLGFTVERWTQLTMDHFLKEQPSLQSYYPPALKERLTLATVFWASRSRQSLLSDWENHFRDPVS